MTDTLLQLAARCEAATGPDRKLDAALCREIDLPSCVYPDCLPDVLEQIIARTESGEWDQDPDCPFYTASLDAAMTLAPEGWRFSVASRHPTGCEAQVWRSLHDGTNGQAATPSLALCAASLKARAAQGGAA